MARIAGAVLVVLALSCSLGWATAQLPNCGPAMNSMLDCLGYVTGTSPAPSSTCCSGVASVFKTEPVCLCELIVPGGAGGSLPGFNITLAKALPGLCKINGADPNNCKALLNGTTPASTPTGPAAGAPVALPPSGGSASTYSPTAFIGFAAAAIAVFMY